MYSFIHTENSIHTDEEKGHAMKSSTPNHHNVGIQLQAITLLDLIILHSNAISTLLMRSIQDSLMRKLYHCVLTQNLNLQTKLLSCLASTILTTESNQSNQEDEDQEELSPIEKDFDPNSTTVPNLG